MTEPRVLILGVVPYDTVDHWLQSATPERQNTKKRRVAKVDVLKGRTGRDVYRVGALFHHFAEKRDQLMFCSLDPGKGQDGVREGVLREFCVGKGSCNFSSKSTNVNEGKNHAMGTRAEQSFVSRVTDKLDGRKLTHILDEWCFIPIKWCDGGGGGNTIYHSDQKFHNIVELAENGLLANGCKVMIPTHCDALETVFGDPDGVLQKIKKHFEVDLKFDDEIDMESNPLWVLATAENPLPWNEINVEEIDSVRDHFWMFLSRYSPWGHSSLWGDHEGDAGNLTARAWKTGKPQIWKAMNAHCSNNVFGGLETLMPGQPGEHNCAHHSARKTRNAMHPVMIEFTYVAPPVAEEYSTVCTNCRDMGH